MDERVRNIIDKSKKVVFFGGAGVSTESNIPDFRSESGLYHAVENYGYPPEQMLSRTFFMNHTEKFFDYYKNNLIYPDAMPNKAHIALAQMEKEGKLIGVVTQNIDGLHQKAGSKKVYELHGSVLRNYCMDCGKFYDVDYIMDEEHCVHGIPKCSCGGTIKPDVVTLRGTPERRGDNRCSGCYRRGRYSHRGRNFAGRISGSRPHQLFQR